MRYISIIFLFLISNFANAQKTNAQKEDSILNSIKNVTDNKLLYKAYKSLSELSSGIDPKKEIMYLDKALFAIEINRNREEILEANIEIITQLLGFSGIEERNKKAMGLIDKSITLAKESQLNEKTATFLMRKAALTRTNEKYNEALKFNEEASNYADLSANDSLKVMTTLSFANTLIAKDENMAAFKKYMNALNLAEETNNDNLRIDIYSALAGFYTKIKQNEKAKDYLAKVLNLNKKLKNENGEINTYSTLVFLYAGEKDFTTAREYLKLFKNKIEKDGNPINKTRVLVTEVNLLLQEDITKVAKYFRENPLIVNDLRQWGYGSEADKALGMMYSLEKRNDSAEYYFKISKEQIYKTANVGNIINWNQAYVQHLERNNKLEEASKLTETSLKLSQDIGSLTFQKAFREILDSFYIKLGSKNLELTNKVELYKITDSLDKQQKAKDVINIEIDTENKNQERIQKIKADALNKKHNLQYMGITAGIVSLFILLVGLGKFKVKPNFIRALGFLSFILLFEFIILLADTKIHHITHGDPLQILLIKIVLIAILLPLHHWLEHKAIKYLLKGHKITVDDV